MKSPDPSVALPRRTFLHSAGMLAGILVTGRAPALLAAESPNERVRVAEQSLQGRNGRRVAGPPEIFSRLTARHRVGGPGSLDQRRKRIRGLSQAIGYS